MRLTVTASAPLSPGQLEDLRKAVAQAKDQEPRLPDDPLLRAIVESAQPHVDHVLEAIVDNVARVLDRSLD